MAAAQSLRADAAAFLVGSSVVTTIVTITYVGVAYARRGLPAGFDIQWYTLLFSLVYGLGALAIKRLILDPKGVSYNWALLVGAAVGLTLSLIGRFAAHLPQRLFGMSAEGAWKVHVIAPVLYALVFRLWVFPILWWVLRC